MNTILCIDDEPLILKVLKRELSPLARVLTAASAEMGLQLLTEERVHVVVSDMSMPKMSGLELMAILRARYPDIVRILLTGQADVDPTIAESNGGHAFRILRKPWSQNELHATASRALEQALRLQEAR